MRAAKGRWHSRYCTENPPAARGTRNALRLAPQQALRLRPIGGVSNGDTLRQLLVGCITPILVPAPELPSAVVTLIDAMLSRNPERRPSNFGDVSVVLRTHAPAR